MHLRTIHLLVGIAGLVVFAGTGQYMHWVHGGLQTMADGPRLFFRSAHIYLLWSALLNLMLGCYLVRLPRGILRRMQFVGSLAIVLGPLLLGTSFFVEQHNVGLLRPMGQLAIFLSFGGALLHALPAMRSRVMPSTT